MIIDTFFGPGLAENCLSCKLRKKCKTPSIETVGKGKKKILLVIDGPTSGDDERGKLLSGTTGRALRHQMRMMGYDLFEDFWITSAMGCKPKKEANKQQVKKCRWRLQDTVEDLKPIAIITMGNTANDALFGEHVHTTSQFSLAENMIPLHDYDCWALPVVNPQLAVTRKHDENLKAYSQFVLHFALDQCKDLPKLQKLDYISPVQLLTTGQDVIAVLNNLLDNPQITAFDYEGTGLNPFKPGHKITSMSISTKNTSWAFPLDHIEQAYTKAEYKQILDLVKEYLEDPDMPKIAHKSQFETLWSQQVLKCIPQNMHWCTKTTAHILDQRSGITGLKHLAFAKWGIKDYDSISSKYIRSKEGEEFNKMYYMPLHSQLLYCGIDSFLTMQLYIEQSRELLDRFPQQFFNNVNNLFAKMTTNGIHISRSFYAEKKKDLESRIKNIEEELNESQEVITYCNNYGKAGINWGSNDDLTEFFFEHLNLKSKKKTATGKPSVDVEALGKLEHWTIERLLKIRKFKKIKDTYIAQFEREEVDGYIHPNFNLFVPVTFRSSSQNPNFQNIPKRDALAKLLTRMGLKPSFGNRLIELDFGGAEVITSAGYNKDPNLIEYLLNEDADMHRDNASDIWIATADIISDMVRFYAKNGWTFPQFYGDWYESCAKALWENKEEKLENGKTCFENLKENGIKSLQGFIKHCQKVQVKMWDERFPVYSAWKDSVNKQYREDLCLDTYLGFRFIGYLDKKQVANYQIQGTSFHLLLHVLLKMDAWIVKNKMETKMIGQIHDSGFFDSPEHEVENVIEQFELYTHELYDEFQWMEVPMEADAEVSLVDGDMSHMFKWKWDKPVELLEEKARMKWMEKDLELLEAA